MSRARRRAPHTNWEQADDQSLLDMRFDRLGLELSASTRAPLQRAIQRLGRELAATELRFQPHVWLSTDFFSPDGVPGIAIPFYLAHGRLIRLEHTQSHHAEGVREPELMRLLRHEAGHAVDTAFKLHQRSDWREHFGLRSEPYRRTYSATPSSQEFVRYLPRWYAQSHPAEDFAETFAVWLDRRSNWRARYPREKLGARRKLEFVDRLMQGLVGRKPAVRLREKTESIDRTRTTLGEHYAAERRRRAREPTLPYSAVLDTLFSARDEAPECPAASSELVRLAPAVRALIRGPFRHDAYSIEQVWQGLLHACKVRHLTLGRGTEERVVERIARLIPACLDAWERGAERLGR